MHNNYTLLNGIIKGAADPERTGANMKNTDTLLDDFLQYKFYQFEEERRVNAGAFLLTEKESRAIEKAAVFITKMELFNQTITGLIENPETMQRLAAECINAFQAAKLNIKKLRGLSEKISSGLYWSIKPELEQKEDANGVKVTAGKPIFNIIISTEEDVKNISLDTKHAFFKAETMQERAAALGLSDLYLYISSFELNILELLRLLFDIYDAKQKAEPIRSAQNIGGAFYPILSTNIFNALSSIGANAKNPTIKKKRSEQGREYSITDYCTSAGINISFSDFSPYAAGGFICVGDPNTDKLLLQAQLITAQTGKKELEISISDFMKFRGYSNNYRKEAIEKARQACERLSRAGSDVDISDNAASIKGRWNYTQKCFVTQTENHGANKIIIVWTDDILEHIIKFTSKGQQIEQFDKNIISIPDNQSPAYNIARKFSRHTRSNAGKNNDHKLSVQTLLDACPTLPLYTENYKEIPQELKTNYIKYPSQAPARIIEPFIDALEYITSKKPILKSYKFKNKSGHPLTDAELSEARKNYKAFISLFVEVAYMNEPDYKHLIEQKAKHQTTETPEKGKGKK